MLRGTWRCVLLWVLFKGCSLKRCVQEGTLWISVQSGTSTHTNRTVQWVWISALPVIALTRPWELFVPNICTIRGDKPIEREGTPLPVQCHAWCSQVGQRWPEVTPRLQPASCGSFCFGKDHSKVTVKLHTPTLLFFASVSITRSSDHWSCCASAFSLPRMSGWHSWQGHVWAQTD